MVAKLQFAAALVRFDIAFVVGQLARFCASAAQNHWTALHHLIEYLAKYPNFQLELLDYRKYLSTVIAVDSPTHRLGRILRRRLGEH